MKDGNEKTSTSKVGDRPCRGDGGFGASIGMGLKDGLIDRVRSNQRDGAHRIGTSVND
jgi:hypothetical protein